MKKISEEQEYNRSLEERIDKWMEETSDSLKKMDEECEKMMDALPYRPESLVGSPIPASGCSRASRSISLTFAAYSGLEPFRAL